MTTHHTSRTPVPSALSNRLSSPAVDRTPIRQTLFRVATRAVVRLLRDAALLQHAQPSLPNSLYSALHEFNPPQRLR